MKHLIIVLLFIGMTISTKAFSQTSDSEYNIYFALRESPNDNIKIMSYDGKRLDWFKPKNGSSSRGENKPAISSNGKWIVFNTYHFGGWKAAIADIDGSNIRQVSNSGNYNGFASFSADNKWIIYYEHENGRQGKRNIFKIRVDGTERTQLTRNSLHHYFPSFSPDGKMISFVSAREGGNYEVFVMDSDGNNIKNITDHKNHDSCASWSPDGKRIAFLSIRGGYLNLYTMNPDGSDLINVTKNKERGAKPFNANADTVDELSYLYGTSWSPDGKSIVFVQVVDDKQKLFIINANGENLRRVVDTKGNQFNPFWVK